MPGEIKSGQVISPSSSLLSAPSAIAINTLSETRNSISIQVYPQFQHQIERSPLFRLHYHRHSFVPHTPYHQYPTPTYHKRSSPNFRATIYRINTKPSTCDSTLTAHSPHPQRSNPARQPLSSPSPTWTKAFDLTINFSICLDNTNRPRIVESLVVNGQRPRRMS